MSKSAKRTPGYLSRTSPSLSLHFQALSTPFQPRRGEVMAPTADKNSKLTCFEFQLQATKTNITARRRSNTAPTTKSDKSFGVMPRIWFFLSFADTTHLQG